MHLCDTCMNDGACALQDDRPADEAVEKCEFYEDSDLSCDGVGEFAGDDDEVHELDDDLGGEDDTP